MPARGIARLPDATRPRPTAVRRICAAGGLLALAGALAVLAGGLVGNIVWLPVALVAVLVVVLGAWSALVHKGWRRIVGLVVAIAAIAGLIVLLNPHAVVRIGLITALALLAGAAARIAVGHDLVRWSASAGVTGPASHGALLVNPRSGGGKAGRFDLVEQARRRGIQPIVLNPGDDLAALAQRAADAGADVLGMAGGDGSQAVVADIARRHNLGFVCVPAGTRNHFALDLGLDRDDVVGALDGFGTAIERRVDLAMIGDRVFVNNASLGVYAAIVQSDAYRDAKLATAADLLPTLLGPDAPAFDLRFDGPDDEPHTSADLILVSNDSYRLRALGGFGTRARIDEGVLGVVTVAVNRAKDLPALVTAEASRRIDRFPGYRQWTTSTFRIDSTQPALEVGVDGEALRLTPPLVFRSLPGALRVRIPPQAVGVSPAAARPPNLRRMIVALLRVLIGRPAG